ncbi:hypothetical protein ZWY2020_007664 [Hordeum vulgare]|nr:hypothetical protein ZWY2020_007664 [Hordeum vulgare]
MHEYHAAAEAMEPLPHEISEREEEMHEPSESNELLEELCMDLEEVEKRLSVEKLAMEYQRELRWRHYYEFTTMRATHMMRTSPWSNSASRTRF